MANSKEQPSEPKETFSQEYPVERIINHTKNRKKTDDPDRCNGREPTDGTYDLASRIPMHVIYCYWKREKSESKTGNRQGVQTGGRKKVVNNYKK